MELKQKITIRLKISVQLCFRENDSFGHFICYFSNDWTPLTRNIIKFSFETSHATKTFTNNFYLNLCK